eukprot:scaffold14553_cov74-Phaeocystis_antarctica.AAC.4
MHIEATSFVVSATEVAPGASCSPTVGTIGSWSQSVVVEQMRPPTSVTIGSARSSRASSAQVRPSSICAASAASSAPLAQPTCSSPTRTGT